MDLKNREQYLMSLKRMRPNIYKFGDLIQDVSIHPATRRTVESHAKAFELASDDKFRDIFTTTSYISGRKIYRFNSLMQNLEDIIYNSRFKRTMYHLTGTCSGALCVGWHAQNVLWNVTYEIDKELGTNYQERLRKWILFAEENGLAVAGALTDAKGDRSLKPNQQESKNSYLHINKVLDDGIEISGVKAMICGVAAANEIFILPGAVYKEEDKDCAVACVVPRDINGLTIIETRRPSDTREYEEGFDIPQTGITQAYLIFDKVFVPKDRVFMCGEYQYSSKVIEYFTANYRACIGACVAGQGDVMIGAAVLIARANGLSESIFKDKIVQMAINNETTYGMGIGAMAMGYRHPAGVWVSDSMIAHANKVHVATLPYETKRLCQEIAGGIAETGCFPSYRDIIDDRYGLLIQEALKANKEVSAEARARAARLIEWLTIGAGVPGCMHGGGSPDGARMVVRAKLPLKEYIEYAKQIAGIKEEIAEPQKKK
jgi:4-hydroxybutyryl-CoA dehydratase/vinylacetyl-CoA-Delta-isomerase